MLNHYPQDPKFKEKNLNNRTTASEQGKEKPNRQMTDS